MLLQWNKFAQRLSDKGQKIMESLLLINDPKLEGTTIIHELPNEGSKIDFESGKHDLVGYLRGKLHNHDIEIKIIVNESMESKKAFTPQDRYNRLNQINPNLDTLRRTFDLDF
ncbi:MAG: DNA polymerase III [Flavobacterium sp.]|nr:MAG: DNA polymerase III [Flavobacterium sp.]